jgi:hypothetical protein
LEAIPRRLIVVDRAGMLQYSRRNGHNFVALNNTMMATIAMMSHAYPLCRIADDNAAAMLTTHVWAPIDVMKPELKIDVVGKRCQSVSWIA